MTCESLKNTKPMEQRLKEFNYIFIGGCGRSGTTFLADLLGRALGWTIIPESQFKEKLLLIDFNNNEVRKKAVRELMFSWRLRIWELQGSLSQKTVAGAKSVKDVMNLISRAYATMLKRNCVRWIDHTPTNVNCFYLLKREFPDSLFIHLVRDPRAVWASVKDLDWGPNSVCEFTKWWAHAVANGLSAEFENASNTIRLRYEDVCVDTAKVLDIVEKKINAENLVIGHQQKKEGFLIPEYTKSQHKLVGLPPQRERIDRWKKLLSKREIEIIEIKLAALMNCFGYEIYTNPPWQRPKWIERAVYAHLSIWPKVVKRKIRRKIIIARQRKNINVKV